MFKTLIVGSIAGLITLGVPSLSFANGEGRDNGKGNGGQDNGGHKSAPEPLTVLGLALGAGGTAVARWASKRKKSRAS
jgi:hypothetical protein